VKWLNTVYLYTLAPIGGEAFALSPTEKYELYSLINTTMILLTASLDQVYYDNIYSTNIKPLFKLCLTIWDNFYFAHPLTFHLWSAMNIHNHNMIEIIMSIYPH